MLETFRDIFVFSPNVFWDKFYDTVICLGEPTLKSV